MKTKLQLMTCLAAFTLASCQGKVRCTLDIETVNEDGTPVAGAKASVRRTVSSAPNPGGGFPRDVSGTVSGISDAAGRVRIEYETLSGPEGLLWIQKEGYYESVYQDAVTQWKPVGKFDSGVWQASLKAVLKPVKKPIPMHVTRSKNSTFNIIRIPEIGREYAYDLKEGSPLPPLGDGKTADFFFKVTGHNNSLGDYDLSVDIRFPDEDAGVIAFETPLRKSISEPSVEGSLLQSGYEAPVQGYTRVLKRSAVSKSTDKRATIDSDFKRNFYFRSRVKRGANGKIQSANYGKIYGDFDFSGGNVEKGTVANLLLNTTYFNPALNDRNVEFDIKRNLNGNTSDIDWP